MNAVLQNLSLLAGGSHYPTVNPAMQQRFAELIVDQCCDLLRDRVEVALDASGNVVDPEELIRQHFEMVSDPG
jgi:hypothetical protein